MSMLVDWLKYLKKKLVSLFIKSTRSEKLSKYLDVSPLDQNNVKLSISSVIYIATDNLYGHVDKMKNLAVMCHWDPTNISCQS